MMRASISLHECMDERLRKAGVRLAAALAVLAAAGCGPEPALQRGTELFNSTSLSPADSNVFACSTCHSVQPGGDPSKRLPGYALHDVTARPTWWGGSYDWLLDAVNECYVEFMRGTRFTPDDADGRALLVYLASISPDAQSAALPLTTVTTLDATYYNSLAGGDAGQGAMLYTEGCAYCHGALHTGAGRLGPNQTIIPDETIRQHGTDPTTGARAITIEKVRHGKFFSVGGNMAEYSLEALTDKELADILAYMGF
jgi:thiosulfate dehydrogenase